MRALIQRVTTASVTINGHLKAAINNGLLVFAGIEDADTFDDMVECEVFSYNISACCCCCAR